MDKDSLIVLCEAALVQLEHLVNYDLEGVRHEHDDIAVFCGAALTATEDPIILPNDPLWNLNAISVLQAVDQLWKEHRLSSPLEQVLSEGGHNSGGLHETIRRLPQYYRIESPRADQVQQIRCVWAHLLLETQDQLSHLDSMPRLLAFKLFVHVLYNHLHKRPLTELTQSHAKAAA